MAGPAFRAAAVRVRVPATSANLGPGFDALGLSLGLYDDVVVRVADSGLHIDIAGEGSETLPRDESHLLVRSLRTAFDLLGGQPRAAWRSSAPTASRTAAASAPHPPPSAPESSPPVP
ncbi:Homoserine kinase [Streptomyces microflavus]